MASTIAIGKLFVGIAAGLSILVGLYLLLSPVEVYSITATTLPGGQETTQEQITQQSWYQTQGLWGVFVLFLFAGLYSLGYFLARKEAYTWLVILSLSLMALSYLAGFSIGLLYLPAALILFLGAGILVFSNYRQQRP
jgi:Ca2+/Na+ antiporter